MCAFCIYELRGGVDRQHEVASKPGRLLRNRVGRSVQDSHERVAGRLEVWRKGQGFSQLPGQRKEVVATRLAG